MEDHRTRPEIADGLRTAEFAWPMRRSAPRCTQVLLYVAVPLVRHGEPSMAVSHCRSSVDRHATSAVAGLRRADHAGRRPRPRR